MRVFLANAPSVFLWGPCKSAPREAVTKLIVNAIEFVRKITFGRSTCGSGNRWQTAGAIYDSQALRIREVGVAPSRMNTGFCRYKTDRNMQQESAGKVILTTLITLLCDNSSNGTFVTLGSNQHHCGFKRWTRTSAA